MIVWDPPKSFASNYLFSKRVSTLYFSLLLYYYFLEHKYWDKATAKETTLRSCLCYKKGRFICKKQKKNYQYIESKENLNNGFKIIFYKCLFLIIINTIHCSVVFTEEDKWKSNINDNNFIYVT